jgi:hypothetical protein
MSGLRGHAVRMLALGETGVLVALLLALSGWRVGRGVAG